MDVDTALPEVPVNIAALIDDTDFKTREESVTFDQSGLDLVWNFVTTAGAFTQTAVTPTDTAGDYDWVNQGNGDYTIEIPLSGGATINNDREGFGWFNGFATGILPWRGPTIGFRLAETNDMMVDAATSDEISSTQSQVSNLTVAGSASKQPARLSPDGFVITFGENEANNEDATRPLDGVTHDIEAQDDTGTERIDVFYEFNVGAGIPSEVTWHGQLDRGGGGAKNILVQARDLDAATWRTIGTITSGNSIETDTFDLFINEVGTGSNLGTVRIRFLTGSVAFTSTTKLLTDQIFCSSQRQQWQ